MPSPDTRFCSRPLWKIVAFVLLVTYCRISGAQSKLTPEAAEALKTKVHLRLGTTTLQAAVEALAKQTGWNIVAVPYLLSRRVVVQLDDVSGLDALDTLAEANDWHWQQTEKGRIELGRPTFATPKTLYDIAPAFRAIVPQDLRRFIGLGVPESDIRAAYVQAHPNDTSLYVQIMSTRLLLRDKLGAPIETEQASLVPFLTPEVKAGKVTRYADLTMEQQTGLLLRFVCEAMQETTTTGIANASALIQGHLTPERLDETKMRVHYEKNWLTVGSFVNGQESFSEQLASPKQFPDPLRERLGY